MSSPSTSVSMTVANATQTARPPIMTRELALVFLSGFGMALSFYLLLSVVPLYAASVGAGGIGAGLTTGALMFATVAAELATPGLAARLGYRRVFAAGLFLLGAPALALIWAHGMLAILAVCLVRGVGFAITVVLGSALVAVLVPPERRGEGLGLYGIVVGVPGVIGLPAGVWLAQHVGYPTVFVAGALSALAGLVAVPGLPQRAPTTEPPVGILEALRSPGLVRPAFLFSTTALAAGAVFTFLPIAVTRRSGNVAALALFAHAIATTLTRWWAGHYADRHDASRLLIPSVIVAASGMFLLVLTSSSIAVVGGMILFGCGFGVAQNASLTLMYERTSASGYDSVSAMWNLAFDTGLGVGGAGFGVLAAQTGYPPAFAATALLMLAALAIARRER